MVTAVFTDNDDYARAYGLWQWDYGQQLRIEGLHLPTAVEIHFALQETGGEAITRVGTTKDGVTTVTIPDSMLEGNRAAWTAEKAYNIYAWIYLSDQKSGETIKHITMQVKSRPKPEAFEAPGDGEIFREAIEAVNDAAKRAEEAGGKAVAAADEAEKAATQTAEHLEAVQGLAEQVETNADTVAQDKQTVTGMLSQAQQEASDAALSAQAAKLSETAAAQAQTGAETAEDTARQYAEETEADRQAVANDRQAVSQMREAVAADRQAVEQTAAQFGQTSQDALTAIGQAQSTAVGAVKAEGNKQTTAVQEAGTQAVSEVAEAKTTAVEAVTTEGDTQTKRVEDAAAGIIADREQINQNKADIAGLVEGMTDLAPAILNTASGSVITADDATEGRLFRGLRVFGKSTQDGAPTPEAPVPIVSAGESGNITVEVGNGNLFKTLQHSAGYYTGEPGSPVRKNTNTGYSWEAELLVLPGTELTLSVITSIMSRFRCYVIDDNGIILLKHEDSSANSVDYTHTFAVPEKGTKMCLSVMEASAPEGTTIMLNSGKAALPYEPYRAPQTLTLATPNGLPGVPVSKDGNYTDADGQQWICDEIDLGRGKYVQRIETRILDGTEAWKHRITNSGNNNFQILINDRPSSAIHRSFCNYLPYKNFIWDDNIVNLPKIYSYDLEITASFPPESEFKSVEIWNSWLKEKGDFKFRILQNNIYLKIDGVTTTEEGRQWLESNDITIIAQASTPESIPLSPSEQAQLNAITMYAGTTEITNNGGCTMDLTYTADTKTYIDNKLAAISAAMIGGT